jgi:hypothetical protein
MALMVCLDVSFDNTQYWKGIREKSGEVNSAKAYVTNDKTVPVEISTGVMIVGIGAW